MIGTVVASISNRPAAVRNTACRYTLGSQSAMVSDCYFSTMHEPTVVKLTGVTVRIMESNSYNHSPSNTADAPARVCQLPQ